MPRILEFRIDPDRRRAATRLQNWMLDFMNMDPALPVTEQDLLSSEALRQMVYNYISDARDAAHPTLGHAPNFYHLWRDYLQTYDRMRAPAPAQPRAPLPPPPPDLLASLGLPEGFDLKKLRRAALLAQYEPLDNLTEIYGTRRDANEPMEEPRHYYSEEDFNNCPWHAQKMGVEGHSHSTPVEANQ